MRAARTPPSHRPSWCAHHATVMRHAGHGARVRLPAQVRPLPLKHAAPVGAERSGHGAHVLVVLVATNGASRARPNDWPSALGRGGSAGRRCISVLVLVHGPRGVLGHLLLAAGSSVLLRVAGHALRVDSLPRLPQALH